MLLLLYCRPANPYKAGSYYVLASQVGTSIKGRNWPTPDTDSFSCSPGPQAYSPLLEAESAKRTAPKAVFSSANREKQVSTVGHNAALCYLTAGSIAVDPKLHNAHDAISNAAQTSPCYSDQSGTYLGAACLAQSPDTNVGYRISWSWHFYYITPIMRLVAQHMHYA